MTPPIATSSSRYSDATANDMEALPTRRTFSGFSTRISISENRDNPKAAGGRRQRGRFEIEGGGGADGEEAEVDDYERSKTNTSCSSLLAFSPATLTDSRSQLVKFVRRDKHKSTRRRRLFEVEIRKEMDYFSWRHLGSYSRDRTALPIDPMVVRNGHPAIRQSSEFHNTTSNALNLLMPPSLATSQSPSSHSYSSQSPSSMSSSPSPSKVFAPALSNAASSSSSMTGITRRAITTLLSGNKKKSPDSHFILHLVHLAIRDGFQTRACLLLHVGFGLPMPKEIEVSPTTRIPDFIGTNQLAFLKKPCHHPMLHRIFTRALDVGMDAVCLMLISAGFPKSPFDRIFGDGKGLLPSFLSLAIAYKRIAVIRAFLETIKLGDGALDSCRWRGWTHLSLAIALIGPSHPRACLQVASMMLSLGADPRICSRLTSKAGQHAGIRPLELAAGSLNCDLECRWCLLLQSDLDITVRLIKAGAKVDQRDSRGNTPLILAAKQGLTDLVAILIHADAFIDSVNRLGRTALHEAAEGGHRGTIEYLIGEGADFNLIDSHGNTALQLCLKSGVATDDLLDYFDRDQRVMRMSSQEEIRDLINQVDAFHLAEDSTTHPYKKKTKRRFLIEKFMSLPKQWISNMKRGDSDGDAVVLGRLTAPNGPTVPRSDRSKERSFSMF